MLRNLTADLHVLDLGWACLHQQCHRSVHASAWPCRPQHLDAARQRLCDFAGLWKIRAKAPTPKTMSVAGYGRRLAAFMGDAGILQRMLKFYMRHDIRRMRLHAYICRQKAFYKVCRQVALARPGLR